MKRRKAYWYVYFIFIGIIAFIYFFSVRTCLLGCTNVYLLSSLIVFSHFNSYHFILIDFCLRFFLFSFFFHVLQDQSHSLDKTKKLLKKTQIELLVCEKIVRDMIIIKESDNRFKSQECLHSGYEKNKNNSYDRFVYLLLRLAIFISSSIFLFCCLSFINFLIFSFT